LKILLVAHSYPRHEQDMAGSFLLALARELRSLGDELLVVAPHAPGAPERETLGGVAVHRYRYGSDDDETLAYAGTMHEQVMRSWSARGRLIAFLAAQRRAVRHAAARFSPDVIHAHWWFPAGLALWPGWRDRPPVVLTSHGTDLFLLDRMPLARLLARPVLGTAAQVTVISTPLIDRVRALGVAPERITVVPMPMDRVVFGGAGPQRRDPRLLLFVGRLVERKGAEFAVRAVDRLVRQGREVSLTVAGDGPERGRLERLASELAVADRVRFVGTRPPAEIAELYRRCGALVMPAVTDWKGEQEGFGMVLVEAMQAGAPVIATRSGGIPDVVRDGVTGLLVPERDVSALASAITRLHDDPALARTLADAAARDVRARFAPERIARVFHDVYVRARE
jgi:glycosyltransferase involved in cell wall biosynthesis